MPPQLKIKIDAVVKNVAVYIILDVSLEGRKERIGFWIGVHETAQYWLTVLNDIKKRGVEEGLIFAIDGLNGFNQAMEALYPKSEVQRCIVHQIRSSLRLVSWQDRKAVAKDLKGVYTALNAKQALLLLDEFKHIWDKKYPNIAKSWSSHWIELPPFFKYPNGVSRLIYTTHPIESLKAIIKQKTNSRGACPTQGSVLTVGYLVTQQIQELGQRGKELGQRPANTRKRQRTRAKRQRTGVRNCHVRVRV
jgi:transposase-like protein